MPSGLSAQQRLMPITEAAKLTPYTATFLRQLARQGKIDATKIGRDWLITQEELKRFLKNQAARQKQALLTLRRAAAEVRP